MQNYKTGIITIIQAHNTDATALTDLTIQSKGYWKYTTEELQNWKAELTIRPEYFITNKVYKLLIDNSIIGYYSYLELNSLSIHLDNMFLLPAYIGKGFGGKLMIDLIDRLKENNYKRISTEADPNAEGFYNRFGFTKTGTTQSNLHKRCIPIMELQLP